MTKLHAMYSIEPYILVKLRSLLVKIQNRPSAQFADEIAKFLATMDPNHYFQDFSNAKLYATCLKTALGVRTSSQDSDQIFAKLYDRVLPLLFEWPNVEKYVRSLLPNAKYQNFINTIKNTHVVLERKELPILEDKKMLMARVLYSAGVDKHLGGAMLRKFDADLKQIGTRQGIPFDSQINDLFVDILSTRVFEIKFQKLHMMWFLNGYAKDRLEKVISTTYRLFLLEPEFLKYCRKRRLQNGIFIWYACPIETLNFTISYIWHRMPDFVRQQTTAGTILREDILLAFVEARVV